MNETPSAPLPSPDDQRVLSRPELTLSKAIGRSLAFGFVGQIAFTVLQLVIVDRSTLENEKTARAAQLMLFLLPIVCAYVGNFATRRWALRKIGHPLIIAVFVLLIAALGYANFIAWEFTSFEMPIPD